MLMFTLCTCDTANKKLDNGTLFTLMLSLRVFRKSRIVNGNGLQVVLYVLYAIILLSKRKEKGNQQYGQQKVFSFN